ncbi:MAG: aminotransferase class V-fold PLP-dependent enzyme [Flavobacteriales bacterium]
MTSTDTPRITDAELRAQFPLLHQKLGRYDLVYLDNAATTQKPQSVIDAIAHYYTRDNANIHRGVHQIATRATEAFEASREKVQRFLNAAHKEEIVFTSGTTDAINLVAQTWGRADLMPGDEIVVSEMEHHSNIVPWQMLAQEKGAVIKVIPVTATGEWNIEALDALIGSRTKLIAVNHVSNALGTINPLHEVVSRAREVGACVLLDGAQAVSHFPVDVQALDCDFYCFSAHKLYGPTGIGVLYGRRQLLETMPPWRGGGEMIDRVSFSGTTYNKPPYKFEAGTPHIEGVIGLDAAVDFVQSLGWDAIHQRENELLHAATERLLRIDGLKIYGTSSRKVGVISFLAEGIHPYDLGTLLDNQGIAVRTGHHCTQPLWERFGIPGTVRASFAPYNTIQEVDTFVSALEKSIDMLR